MRRIAGLDSIRFFCALTVVFFHQISPPIFSFLSRDTPVGRVVLGLYDAAFNGPAAVIAFFIISGFCIHYPYASGRPFATGPFLLARFVRILFPTGIYLFILSVVPYRDSGLKILLWSIWCELAYYALYPGLRMLFARSSVTVVLAASYVVAAGAILYTLIAREWAGLFLAGNLTWLAGMPCWLLGCRLAEHFANVRVMAPVSALSLWGYRVGAAGLGFTFYFAMLHFHVSFLWSLQFFAVFAYFWIQAELKWHLDRPPNRWFERLGSLTFSIYLMHALAKCIWDGFNPSRGLLWWFAEVGFVLGLSAIFYFLVERPSHLLARFLSRGPGSFGKPVLQKAVGVS